MSRTSKRSDFTLLELLLALSVLLVLSGLTAQLIYSLPLSWRMQSERSARLKGLIALERIADNALRNLVPFTWKRSSDQAVQSIFRGDPELMIGAFRTDRNRDGGELMFLALGRRDDQLVVQYREEPIVYFREEQLPGTLREEILLEEVDSIAFYYADRENGELVWLEDWDEDDDRLIPGAIGLIVRFTDGSEVKYLRRTAGNSFYTSFGGRGDAG